jgi:hypothetical protein
MMIAIFAVPKGSSATTFAGDDTLFVGTVDQRRRVTLFGKAEDYYSTDIVIRVRGKSEVTGNHVLPFETRIDGDKIAEACIAKNQNKKGMVGTIVRAMIKEDFLVSGEAEEQDDQHQLHGAIVDASHGVGVDDYAALGEFIVKFKNGRH